MDNSRDGLSQNYMVVVVGGGVGGGMIHNRLTSSILNVCQELEQMYLETAGFLQVQSYHACTKAQQRMYCTCKKMLTNYP